MADSNHAAAKFKRRAGSMYHKVIGLNHVTRLSRRRARKGYQVMLKILIWRQTF